MHEHTFNIIAPEKHQRILEYAYFWTSTYMFLKQFHLNLLQTAI